MTLGCCAATSTTGTSKWRAEASWFSAPFLTWPSSQRFEFLSSNKPLGRPQRTVLLDPPLTPVGYGRVVRLLVVVQWELECSEYDQIPISKSRQVVHGSSQPETPRSIWPNPRPKVVLNVLQ